MIIKLLNNITIDSHELSNNILYILYKLYRNCILIAGAA